MLWKKYVPLSLTGGNQWWVWVLAANIIAEGTV
jgi:hypothetical protein